MQGEVLVPYTGIGGTNMDSGIMTMDLTGSTNPGPENVSGSTVNARWAYPGGIISKGLSGKIAWGYALQPGVVCTDDDIKKWLTNQLVATRANVIPSHNFSVEDLDDPLKENEIKDAITKMLEQYVHDVLFNGDYNRFRDYYEGCVYLV